MSKSKRKPIIKDKPRNRKASTYYKRIRRIFKQLVKAGKEDLPNSKSIVNDYDYSDYTFDFRFNSNKEDKDKWSRK